jgi:hypothetical protein
MLWISGAQALERRRVPVLAQRAARASGEAAMQQVPR